MQIFQNVYLHSYDISSRRKPSDRSKRSHHRRSPTSSRHGHRRHREDREDQTHSTSRRRNRDRVIKDRSPVKVKSSQYLTYIFPFRRFNIQDKVRIEK